MNAEDIFHAALAKPPAERPAFLDNVCAGDAALLQRIDALLHAHENPGSFLQAPGASNASTQDDPIYERPGTIIGPYKLLEQIGEGGFGVVFMAEQTEPISRKVALKVIKPGMDTRQVIARFEAERQALALMDHPNIARVLDAGETPSARPFFVMELVRGVPITQYCDEVRMLPRERLELFTSVCQAIQHAHQKGIIHRDIKPNNVLVTQQDGKPLVKVIDFGIAKATGQQLTEKTLFTNFAQMIGTPLYMSPEQAGLSTQDVDTRSDIYSLGVLLYELLTGLTPFDKERMKKSAFEEIRRIIREEEPPRPSARLSESKDSLASISALRQTEPAKLTKLVRGEPDWIVMKALDKDRNRRYETANGLANDVQRHLSGEAVQAHPPSALYRLRKFVRRHGPQVLTASLLFLVLLASLGFVLWHNRELDNKNRELLAAKETAEQREAENTAVLEFVEKRVFAAARPKGYGDGLGHDVKLKDALNAALPFVEASFNDQPHIQVRVRGTLGKSFHEIGDYTLAAEQYAAALAIAVRHLGPDHQDTRKCKIGLADCYISMDRFAEAKKLLEEVLAAQQVEYGDSHPATLETMNSLAISYRGLSRFADSLRLNQQVLAVRRTSLGPDNIDTLGSVVNVGINYSELGRTEDAVKYHEEALPILKAKYRDHDFTLNCMSNLASYYRSLQRVTEATELHEQVLVARKAKLGPDHPETIGAKADLAMSYYTAGDFAKAIQLSEEALAQYKTKLGPPQLHTLGNMVNIGRYWVMLGQHEEAIKLYEAALPILNDKYPNHEFTVTCNRLLAVSYAALGRHSEAVRFFEAALVLLKPSGAAHHPDMLRIAAELANSYKALGRNEDALKLCEEMLTGCKATYGPEHELTLIAMTNLANSFHAVGRQAEALRLREETLSQYKAKFGPDNEHTLVVMTNLAISYHAGGRHAEALHLNEEALSRLKTILGPHHRTTLMAMTGLTGSYIYVGRVSEATALAEEELKLAQTHLPAHDRVTFNTMTNLAGLLLWADPNVRDPERALELATKAMTLAPEYAPEQAYARANVGIARYRLGNWKAAVQDLGKALTLTRPDDPEFEDTGFYLAMAYWQLGDKDKARTWFAKAAQWADKDTRKPVLLDRLRAEAAELMGMETKK